MRVRCANCGMIFEEQPYMGDCYAYPKNYKIIEKCPHCNSNAYDPLKKEKAQAICDLIKGKEKEGE